MTSATLEPGVAGIVDRVRDAAERGARLRITGSGEWLDAGRPVHADAELSTRDHAGIVAYVPGDLTLTARAGTTLGEIRDATTEHNQWLALDPHGSDTGTLGATVATASAGPLATHFGTPRDLVLGVEFVSGRAAVVRGGGRVVKNVAGFDLTRLLVGSWGSLGVVTEVTVRLHARPERDVTLAIPVGDEGPGRVRSLLRRLPFMPYACEIVNAALASDLLGRAATTAIVRLGGNADAVAAQRLALSELGAPSEIDGVVWETLRAADRGALVVRYSDLPSRVGETWAAAAGIAGARVHASPARGIVRVMLPAGHDDAARICAAPAGATMIAERLPADLWPSAASGAPAPGTLAQGVKAAFDPRNVLNPGILGAAP